MKILITLLSVLVLIGCGSPYRKISKEVGRPPLTTKDTFYLSGRCLDTWKIDTGSRVEYILLPPADQDSSLYYQGLSRAGVVVKEVKVDSLVKVYKDTCTSAQDLYNDGFKLGFSVGNYQGLSNRKNDTIIKEITVTKLDDRSTARERSRADLKTIEAEKYRKSSEKYLKYTCFLLALLLAAGVSFFLYVKLKIKKIK